MFVDFPDFEQMPSYGVVTWKNAPVFSKESTASATIAHVADSAVLPMTLWVKPGRQKVTLPDGREGYMLGRHIRSPGDTRAYFERYFWRWRLVGFYAGLD